MGWIEVVIAIIAGAVGGYAIGRAGKSMSLGMWGDLIVGLIGGVILTWLVGLVQASWVYGGGAAYVGVIIAGLIGGAVLTAIVGAIKNATMK
jgi:uncharacterized membrane protein YeaQ/YmgE (transglycosylase-associated protein family)